MKKLSLLLICALAFVGCDVEDDETYRSFQRSEVTDTNLPEYFEEGEIFQVDVSYLLPSACHLPAGLEVNRGAGTGDERRDIYITGVSSYESDMTECDEEEEDLSAEGSFRLRIDEDEPFTFYLWTGVDEDDEFQYTIIEVPVGAPDPADEE